MVGHKCVAFLIDVYAFLGSKTKPPGLKYYFFEKTGLFDDRLHMHKQYIIDLT